jgi:hypothetical protein
VKEIIDEVGNVLRYGDSRIREVIVLNKEEKFKNNEEIYKEICVIADLIEDIDSRNKELTTEVKALIGSKSDSITWDSNKEQDLTRFYEVAIPYINSLGEELDSVKESYEKIISLKSKEMNNV